MDIDTAAGLVVLVFWIGGLSVIGVSIYRAVQHLKTAYAESARPDLTPAAEDDASRARKEQMRALAEANGWQFIPRDDTITTRWDTHVWQPNWAETHPLLKTRVYRRRCENIIIGEHDGHPFMAFDLMVISWLDLTTWQGPMQTNQYMTTLWKHGPRVRVSHGDDDDPTFFCHSVVALSTPTLFPPLMVRPESHVGRAVASTLGRDQKLESDDFNRQFTVRAQNPKFGSDMLDPRMMQALLAEPPSRWETLGPDLVSIQGENPHTAETLAARLDLLDVVYHHIPDHVWRTLGTEPPRS